MTIDLRTVAIEPLRNTYDHIARRFGDKPASRYQEGTYDVQPEVNFHYRPTWDPKHQIFDATRTAIKMCDWYAFKDPRQYYYGSYTIARAKLQEAAEADFELVEERGLPGRIPVGECDRVLKVLLPLRHVAWGSNMNNSAICASGYGTAVTQPCMYQAMDQLGIAQYLTRLGLSLADTDALREGKQAWLKDPSWQPLRRYVEDTLVIEDWFELFVAQNLVLDGLLYPLIYEYFDQAVADKAGGTISMMTRFQRAWFDDASKWVNSVIKIAAGESPENLETISAYLNEWLPRGVEALSPLAALAFGSDGPEIMEEVSREFAGRIGKLGVTL